MSVLGGGDGSSQSISIVVRLGLSPTSMYERIHWLHMKVTRESIGNGR